jgi:translation elongation factor EF-G
VCLPLPLPPPIIRSVEVHVPSANVGAVFSCLAHHGGCITSDEVVGCGAGGDLDPVHARHVVQATMPAALSFGLSTDLQSATSGKAFPQCQFLRYGRKGFVCVCAQCM